MKMMIQPSGATHFTFDPNVHKLVGYHASTILAARQIESVGFLPRKILSEDTHKQLLHAAEELDIPTFTRLAYREWLQMRSVTFTKKPESAISHARLGRAGGQGLDYVRMVLEKASRVKKHQSLVEKVGGELALITAAQAVVYAVDLSGLGVRLVQADDSPDYLRIYFDPVEPLPSQSIVGPDRLISRINVLTVDETCAEGGV